MDSVTSSLFNKSQEIISGSDDKLISIDVTYPNQFQYTTDFKKIIIFSHGFKGFKDWGPFNEIAKYFASLGYVFVKFNFSHNGTSIDDALNFVDLDAFGNNNFSKELDDLGLVIDFLEHKFYCSLCEDRKSKFNKPLFFLLGHSRGGAISILKTSEDKRISAVISWASPSDLLSKVILSDKVNEWKDKGVTYVYNGRTNQYMPLYYQFYEDCVENKDRLNLRAAIESISTSHLHIHGELDSTVSVKSAFDMNTWNSNTRIHIIKSANHVFGAFHPYNLKEFPISLNEALDTTSFFINDLIKELEG